MRLYIYLKVYFNVKFNITDMIKLNIKIYINLRMFLLIKEYLMQVWIICVIRPVLKC